MEARNVLTVPAAAKRLGLTPAALYAAISSKRLTASTLLGRVVIERKELTRYRRETKIGRPNGRKRARKK